MITIKTKKEFETYIFGMRPVIAMFSAFWCGPCKELKPVVKDIADMDDGIVVLYLNESKALNELFKELKIEGYPTLIGYIDGKEIKRRVGSGTYLAITRFFRKVIK